MFLLLPQTSGSMPLCLSPARILAAARRAPRPVLAAFFCVLGGGTGASAQDAVEQYLKLAYAFDAGDADIEFTHGLSGLDTGAVSTAIDQALTYDLMSNSIIEYEAELDASHENGIGVDLGLSWDEVWQANGELSYGYVNDRFSFDVSAEADLNFAPFDRNDSNDGDDLPGFEDEDDLLGFEDEDDPEAKLPDWLTDYTTSVSADLEFDPVTISGIELRTSITGGMEYGSFGGFQTEAAAALGFALSPALIGREAKSDLPNSNVRFSHAGGFFSSRPGEVVLAGGRDETGLYKVAALIFNEWEPIDRLSVALGAVGAMAYDPGAETADDLDLISEESPETEGFVFDAAELMAEATVEPVDGWSFALSAGVDLDPEDPPAYTLSAKVKGEVAALFEPGAEVSIDFMEGEAEVSLAADIEGTFADRLSYDLGIKADLNPDGEFDDIELTYGIDLDGPSLRADGQETSLSFGGSYSFITEEVSVDASVSVYF